MTDYDESFPCMGTTMRIVIGSPRANDGPPARSAAAGAIRYLEHFDRTLSRFGPRSELSLLNADEREIVPASALLCAAVGAALWAAWRTDGLVDPTLVDELERAGYAASLDRPRSVALEAALRSAPPRRPGPADPRARWRQVSVDPLRRFVRRPAGLRLDSGGAGKGLAADAVASQLAGHERFVVDCGGDVRIGGPGAAKHP